MRVLTCAARLRRCRGTRRTAWMTHCEVDAVEEVKSTATRESKLLKALASRTFIA